MKIKIITLGLIVLFLSSAFIGNSKVTNSESNNVLETIEINIAMLSQERVWESRCVEFFSEIMLDYQWIVGNKEYRFNVELILDEDILNGNLNTDNYDALVIPGGGVADAEAGLRCLPTLENMKWKRNIADFIKDGGGYFSICGGVALITNYDKKPRSYVEYAYEKSSLGVSCLKHHFGSFANPLTCQFILPPDYVGACAYTLFTGWNLSDFNDNWRGGVCQDYQINNTHPIFDDYLENTRLIRWIGGPSLVVPNNPDREVSVLARYPVEEMCENESTRMYVWEYTGGLRGMIKGIFKGLKDKENLEFTSPFIGAYTHAEDWKRTNRIMKTSFSNQPAMTAEIYPNANKGRIMLSGPHIERNVWWGGRLEEAEDHDHNNLFDGLYNWVDIAPNARKTEWEYNYWINRRCIAWAAKVPDEDLPPVYGPSQVCDFEHNMTTSDFIVFGNSVKAEGIASLDLFYRYSVDDINWSEWILFDLDSDESDGWSWEFNSPNGTGYYQFYSIRTVEYEGYVETENVPPGPDAFVFVEVE